MKYFISCGCGWEMRGGGRMKRWCAEKSPWAREVNWAGHLSIASATCGMVMRGAAADVGGNTAAKVSAIRLPGCIQGSGGMRSLHFPGDFPRGGGGGSPN